MNTRILPIAIKGLYFIQNSKVIQKKNDFSKRKSLEPANFYYPNFIKLFGRCFFTLYFLLSASDVVWESLDFHISYYG